MNLEKIHPDVVKFDEIACCAFRNMQSDIAEIKEKYKKELQEEKYIHILLDIFTNTSYLHFIPSKTHIDFYTEIASKECEQLKHKGTDLLPCGHTTEDHIIAFQTIVKKLNKNEIAH